MGIRQYDYRATDPSLTRELDEKRQRAASLYATFRDCPLQPNCSRVYYPGCADDDSPSMAFPDSEIIYVDNDAQWLKKLREKSSVSNAQIIHASAEEYDPGPVDVLILKGADRTMSLDTAIASVRNGGYVLSGGDVATDLRDTLVRRSDLKLVGIICAETKEEDPLSEITADTSLGVHEAMTKFCFEPGRPEHAVLVETDEELERADPELSSRMKRFREQYHERLTIDIGPGWEDESDITLAKKLKYIIPPKEPGAELWIFQKVSTSPGGI